MMKNVILFLIFNFSITNSFGQTNWQWARSAGDSTSDGSSAIATDASGNVFVTGFFTSQSITFGSFTLTGSGKEIFVVKYDASGNVLWATSGGGGGKIPGGICTDTVGNVYITGSFNSSTINFGSFTLINSTHLFHIYVVKYSSSGNVIWARSAGGSSNDFGNGISCDAIGNVLLTGSFSSPTITFGSYTLTNAGSGTNDIFVVKYSPSGNPIWAVRAGGAIGSGDGGQAISTDKSGNVLVTGHFYSPSITFGSFTLSNAGSTEMFVVKYDSSGNVMWAKSPGVAFSVWGTGISADVNDNVLVTGTFQGPIITFGIDTLTNGTTINTFVVKYDALGNVTWAKGASGTNVYCRSNAIATDVGGNTYVTGWFQSLSVNFGSYILNNAGGTDAFFVKYDAMGNVGWALSGGRNCIGYGISADVPGNIFVTGTFADTNIIFGNDTLFNAIVDTPVTTDIFVAKLNTITGYQENDNSINEINLFPNPATDIFTITATKQLRDAWLEIYNLLGERIYSAELIREQHTINFKIPSGIYLVKVTNSEKQFIKKLIVQ